MMRTLLRKLPVCLTIICCLSQTVFTAPTPSPEDVAAGSNTTLQYNIDPIDPSFRYSTNRISQVGCPAEDAFHVLIYGQSKLALHSYRDTFPASAFGVSSRLSIRIVILPIPGQEEELLARHVMWGLYRCTVSISSGGFQNSQCDLELVERGRTKQLGTIFYQIGDPPAPPPQLGGAAVSIKEDILEEPPHAAPAGSELTSRSPPSLLLPRQQTSASSSEGNTNADDDDDPLTFRPPPPAPGTLTDDDHGITVRIGRFSGTEGPGYISLALLHCLIDLASKPFRRPLTSQKYTCNMIADRVLFEWQAMPQAEGGVVAYEDLVTGLSLLPGQMKADQSGTFTFIIFKDGKPVACGRCRDNSPTPRGGDGEQVGIDGWNVDARRLGGGGVEGGDGTVAVT